MRLIGLVVNDGLLRDSEGMWKGVLRFLFSVVGWEVVSFIVGKYGRDGEGYLG